MELETCIELRRSWRLFYGCFSVIEAREEDASELPVLIVDGAVHMWRDDDEGGVFFMG